MQFLKFYFISAISLLLSLSSCTTDSTDPAGPQSSAQVTISVSDFTSTLEPFPTGAPTRATSVADYNDLKLLTLVLYSGTTPVYESTQDRDDASTYTTFGHFTCSLPFGTYQLVVIGRHNKEGDAFTLTSATQAAYTSEKVRETFCATQPVTVTSTAAQNLNVTLSRIVSRLRVVTTDNRTAEATQIRTTFTAGGKGFNPTTGLATTNTGFSVVNHPSSAAGQTAAIYSYLFLNTDVQTMDITLEVLDDNDQVLSTKVVPNVTLQRNRSTKLTGPLYGSPLNSSFLVDTEWLTESTQPFD